MFLILTVIFFSCCFFLLKYFKKKEGLLSSFSIFAVTYIFYNVLIPLECYITNDYTMYGATTSITLTSDELSLIMLFNILSVLGFGYGYKLSRFNPYIKYSFTATKNKFMPKGVIVLGWASIIIILFFFRSELVNSNSYEGNYTTTYENPIYALLIKLFLLCLGTAVAFNIYKSRKFNTNSIIIFSIGMLLAFYSSSKSQLLAIITGLLSYFVINPLKSTTKFVAVILGMFFFMAILNVAFGYYRYAKGLSHGVKDISNNTVGILKSGFFKSTDARGPMYVLGAELKKKNIDFKFGSSYFQIFSLVIPKAIWHDRPYDLAEEFARTNMNNWSPGQGLGYSFVVEGYVNFGVIGVLVNFILFGIIWGFMWKVLKKMLIRFSSVEYWYSFYFTAGTYIMFLSHRNTFAGNVKTLLLYTIPFILLTKLFKTKTSKNESALGS